MLWNQIENIYEEAQKVFYLSIKNDPFYTQKAQPFWSIFPESHFSALFKAFLVPNKKKDIAKYEWE